MHLNTATPSVSTVVQFLPVYSLINLWVNVTIRAAEHQLQWSPFVESLESYPNLRVMFQPLTLLRSNIQTYKCSAIVNQFRHEFSASSPPTALPNRLGSTQQPTTTQISPPSEYSRPRPCCSPVASWRQSEWQF